MRLDAGNLNLFGVDLRRAVLAFRDGWADAIEWPALAWMSPQLPVRANFPDGSEKILAGATTCPAPHGAKVESRALVLPDELVLTRRLTLPDLVRPDLHQALSLEVAAQSPFPAEDTVWGVRFGAAGAEGRPAALAISSRSHVAALQQSAAAEGRGGSDAEIWAWDDGPVVLEGYGEAARLGKQSRRKNGILLALVAVTLMALILSLVPFILMREQVFDAQARFAVLQGESGELLRARDAAVGGGMRLQAMQARIGERVEFVPMFDAVSAVLPDDVFLTRLDVRAGRVTIAGLATNAAALMETISSNPRFTSVRAPAPIAKADGQRESFTIEFTYVPEGGKGG